jgi:hypothetical protein
VAATDGRYEEEGTRVRKDGSTFWANVVITALRDDAENLRCTKIAFAFTMTLLRCSRVTGRVFHTSPAPPFTGRGVTTPRPELIPTV